MRAWVYTFWGANGEALYVGSTIDIRGRLHRHEVDSPWSAQAARVEVVEFACDMEAVRAETVLIRERRPFWNVVSNPRWVAGPGETAKAATQRRRAAHAERRNESSELCIRQLGWGASPGTWGPSAPPTGGGPLSDM